MLTLQGNAGIGLSLLIIVLTLLVALAPALSAIGICERTHVESGGVYFLLAHVLGQRSGGTIGILYSFGMVRGDDVQVIVFFLNSPWRWW